MNFVMKPHQKAYPQEFLEDVLTGLSASRRYISPRWLYDKIGSEFFEAITDLPEYYVTRTEMKILRQVAPEFAEIIGPNASLVEYGAGAATKARVFLNAFSKPSEYVAIDISFDHLEQSLKQLAEDFPNLKVRPIAGDFLSETISTDLGGDTQKVGFFPGSTIGNLSNDEIATFLQNARNSLGDGSYFILGADLRKSPEILIPAYDDNQKVTAGFNMNLLARINRELGGTIELSKFRHKVVWNDNLSQIEMHLESLENQSFQIAGSTFSIGQGETIHTENSRKFRHEELKDLIGNNGWEITRYETGENGYFAVMLLRAN